MPARVSQVGMSKVALISKPYEEKMHKVWLYSPKHGDTRKAPTTLDQGRFRFGRLRSFYGNM